MVQTGKQAYHLGRDHGILMDIFSSVYQEPGLTAVPSLVSPFVHNYPPLAPYYQQSSQNTLQAPLHNNNHLTQSVFIILQPLSRPKLEPLAMRTFLTLSNRAHDIKAGKRLTQIVIPNNHV